MKRIAISGSHGVGKTTLLDALNDKLGAKMHLIGNIMRTLAAEGYPVGSSTTPDTLTAYLLRQCEQERRAPMDIHVFSDRVLTDGLAYILAAIDDRIASYSWGVGELKILEAAARLHISKYDYHVILPVEFSLVPGDTLHRHGEEFRLKVEQRLRNIVANDWPIPVIEIRGSVEKRVDMLTKLVES